MSSDLLDGMVQRFREAQHRLDEAVKSAVRSLTTSVAELEPQAKRLAELGWTVPMWATPAETLEILAPEAEHTR